MSGLLVLLLWLVYGVSAFGCGWLAHARWGRPPGGDGDGGGEVVQISRAAGIL